MFAYLQLPVSWWTIAKRTLSSTMADNGLGLAAQLAFYFFLALFPALLFMVALLSFLPITNVMDQLIVALSDFTPPEVLKIIQDQLQAITDGQHTGLLTIGFLGALWSSSLALHGIIDAVNRAYGLLDARPYWKLRGMAILLTLALALFIILSFFLVVVGPQLATALADRFGLGPVFEWSWKILQWPVVFLLVVTGIGLVYYFAPDAEQDWVWITPGALLATVLWLAGSLGFRIYVTTIGGYQETYGTIGGMIVLMLWFYISGLAIIIGAEMNSEIEAASPQGKDPGERVPGERRKIGPAAARAYAERMQSAGEAHALAAEVNCWVDRVPIGKPDVRPSDILIGSVAMLPVALRVGARLRDGRDEKDEKKERERGDAE